MAFLKMALKIDIHHETGQPYEMKKMHSKDILIIPYDKS